jgi:hypothetical protein
MSADTEDFNGVQFDMDQYPTILKMWESKAKFKVIIGPAGSAKTSGCIAMLLILAMQQKPFRGVRKSRAIIARNSYQQLVKATTASLRTVLGAVATFTDGKPPKGWAEFPLQDGTRVELEFVFVALDGDSVSSDLRGVEAGLALIDEISEVPDPAVVELLISRLGRYPGAMEGGCTSGGVCLAATNGPRHGSWLHEWALGRRDAQFATIERMMGRPFFELFRQPPALLRPATPDGDWMPSPTAENIRNLPGGYGYYVSMLSMDPPSIQAFVEGDWAELRAGKLVFPGFGQAHILPRKTFDNMWSRRPILLTADWGRTPVVLLAAERNDGGLVVFEELMGEDISVEAFFDETVLPVLNGKMKGCPVIGATGDPSGIDISSASEVSPFSLLHARGIPIELPAGMRVDRIPPRLEATRQRIARMGTGGIPMLQVTDNCKFLISALTRTYVYAQLRGSATDVVAEVPTKSHVGWVSDLADALAYLCLYRSGELAEAGRDPYGAEMRPQRPMFAG